jgi:hypothetical protein
VFEDNSLIALFWAPLVKYNIVGLQKMAGWAVNQTIGFALLGIAEEGAYE